MTKTVLFYARYSTDRQNEVSIETQVELGKNFVERQGWKLAEIYSDAAVSGTSFTYRPGINNFWPTYGARRSMSCSASPSTACRATSNTARRS